MCHVTTSNKWVWSVCALRLLAILLQFNGEFANLLSPVLTTLLQLHGKLREREREREYEIQKSTPRQDTNRPTSDALLTQNSLSRAAASLSVSLPANLCTSSPGEDLYITQHSTSQPTPKLPLSQYFINSHTHVHGDIIQAHIGKSACIHSRGSRAVKGLFSI